MMSDWFARRRAPLRFTGALALSVAALVLNCAASQNAAPSEHSPGSPRQVTFTHYSALFSNAEILRRLLSPLAEEAVREWLLRRKEALGTYPIDLATERFLVYVPTGAPPRRGYALLVFVSASERSYLPFGWTSQLDHDGVIFVSPQRAGNREPLLSRRVPLAVSAEENLVREYPIDRARIYIGGFSGGSRVALRIAVGYPDVFRGALLNAGADALGVADPWGGVDPLPPRDLLFRFQSSSRLVYVSGELDTGSLASDASSSQSMQDWCTFDVETYQTPAAGHEVMSSRAFGRALDRLLRDRAPPDHARLSACRSRVAAEVEEKLSEAQTLISQDRRTAARKLLLDIDKRYGGLAAPRVVELTRSCRCGPTAP